MQRLPHSRSQHRALRRDKRTLAYFPSGHESRGWLPWPWQNLKFGTRRGQVGSRFWQNPRFGTPISPAFLLLAVPNLRFRQFYFSSSGTKSPILPGRQQREAPNLASLHKRLQASRFDACIAPTPKKRCPDPGASSQRQLFCPAIEGASGAYLEVALGDAEVHLGERAALGGCAHHRHVVLFAVKRERELLLV